MLFGCCSKEPDVAERQGKELELAPKAPETSPLMWPASDVSPVKPGSGTSPRGLPIQALPQQEPAQSPATTTVAPWRAAVADGTLTSWDGAVAEVVSIMVRAALEKASEMAVAVRLTAENRLIAVMLVQGAVERGLAISDHAETRALAATVSKQIIALAEERVVAAAAARDAAVAEGSRAMVRSALAAASRKAVTDLFPEVDPAVFEAKPQDGGNRRPSLVRAMSDMFNSVGSAVTRV